MLSSAGAEESPLAVPTISVVIPARDEEGRIELAIRSVAGAEEVVVVDGGSSDGTRAAAQAAGAVVLSAPAGRGVQLDVGARAAGGDWLLFLHADTRLERGWSAALLALPPDVVGGAFRFAVDSSRWAYRIVEGGVRLRCRLMRLPYGDQAIFVRREVYVRTGGFPAYPVMEDVAFVRRLRREGSLAFLRPRALTSPRRWQRHGIVGTTLRNWWLVAQYAAGRRPEALARTYSRGHE
jgi:rSAM/selenodomain-associated transferase 2